MLSDKIFQFVKECNTKLHELEEQKKRNNEQEKRINEIEKRNVEIEKELADFKKVSSQLKTDLTQAAELESSEMDKIKQMFDESAEKIVKQMNYELEKKMDHLVRKVTERVMESLKGQDFVIDAISSAITEELAAQMLTYQQSQYKLENHYQRLFQEVTQIQVKTESHKNMKGES